MPSWQKALEWREGSGSGRFSVCAVMILGNMLNFIHKI